MLTAALWQYGKLGCVGLYSMILSSCKGPPEGLNITPALYTSLSLGPPVERCHLADNKADNAVRVTYGSGGHYCRPSHQYPKGKEPSRSSKTPEAQGGTEQGGMQGLEKSGREEDEHKGIKGGRMDWKGGGG